MPLLASLALACVTARNRKCLPSGRNTGQRWRSYFDLSITVIALGVPPVAVTFEIVLWMLGEKMMVPSAFQLPPRPMGAEHTSVGDPPSIDTVLSLPPAK